VRAVRVPHAAHVRAAEGHRQGGHGRRAGPRGAQQSCREHRGLDREARVGGHALAPDQLRRDERPARVDLGAMRVQARQARRHPRDDERTHHRAVARELDRQMRDVGRHEGGRAAGLDETIGDEDHRQRRVGRIVPPPCDAPGVEAAGLPAVREGLGLAVRHIGRQLRLHGDRPLLARDERGADRGDEACGLFFAGTERAGEGKQHRVGDAVAECVQQALLPRSDVVDPHGPVGAELHAGIGAPQGRVRGGESEHAPIMTRRRRARGGSPQETLESALEPALWRRRCAAA